MAFDQDGVTTTLDRDSVRATAVVDAPPEAVFDYVRRPANHAEISGDHSVRGVSTGPEVLGAGDSFGIKMHIGAPYRVRNKVVEFEPDRKIAWCNFGRQRWRWEVEPAGEGRTLVTETFDLSTALFPPALRLMGLPRGHQKNVASSVRNVVGHFREVGGTGGAPGG
jgi:uncharacterized protein YndB with AHSA1/START domain